MELDEDRELVNNFFCFDHLRLANIFRCTSKALFIHTKYNCSSRFIQIDITIPIEHFLLNFVLMSFSLLSTLSPTDLIRLFF